MIAASLILAGLFNGAFDLGGLFNNELGIHRIEPHPPVSDVDAAAIMLQLIHPAGDRAAGALKPWDG
jgi:hypothetical protein